MIGSKGKADCSIDLFQLENLIDHNIPFLFFNLSAQGETSAGGLAVLKQALRVTEKEITHRLKKADKSKPLVLICEKGDKSRLLSQKLQKAGFINTFFVKGGILSLTKESGSL